jgi:hypothetical protein
MLTKAKALSLRKSRLPSRAPQDRTGPITIDGKRFDKARRRPAPTPVEPNGTANLPKRTVKEPRQAVPRRPQGGTTRPSAEGTLGNAK